MWKIKFKLKDILDERGISQREFSRQSGIRYPFINEMCNNETKHIPVENLVRICETLDCSVNQILELDKGE